MSASQRADRITRLSGSVMFRNEKHVFKSRGERDLEKPCEKRSSAISMCESQTRGRSDRQATKGHSSHVHSREHVFNEFRAAKDRFRCKEIGRDVF
jgi:hypothetical protein